MAWRTCECGNPIRAYDAFTWKDDHVPVCEECSRPKAETRKILAAFNIPGPIMGEPVYTDSNEPHDYVEGPYGRIRRPLDPTRDPDEREFSMRIFKPGGVEQLQRMQALENAKLRQQLVEHAVRTAMPPNVIIAEGNRLGAFDRSPSGFGSFTGWCSFVCGASIVGIDTLVASPHPVTLTVGAALMGLPVVLRGDDDDC